MIDHIAIQVESIKESAEWYTTHFSAEIIYIDETWAMLDMGNVKLALTLPSQHPAHIAITVDSIDKFPIGKQIKSHRDGSMYLYENDPNGNVIEYIHYPED